MMESFLAAAQCACGPHDRERRVLMVRRLHPSVTMPALLQAFGVFGPVVGCKVFTHKNGRSAGCASVEFSTHAGACAAQRALHNAVLNGKAVQLAWYDPHHTTATGSDVGTVPPSLQLDPLAALGAPLQLGSAAAAPAAATLAAGQLQQQVPSALVELQLRQLQLQHHQAQQQQQQAQQQRAAAAAAAAAAALQLHHLHMSQAAAAQAVPLQQVAAHPQLVAGSSLAAQQQQQQQQRQQQLLALHLAAQAELAASGRLPSPGPAPLPRTASAAALQRVSADGSGPVAVGWPHSPSPLDRSVSQPLPQPGVMHLPPISPRVPTGSGAAASAATAGLHLLAQAGPRSASQQSLLEAAASLPRTPEQDAAAAAAAAAAQFIALFDLQQQPNAGAVAAQGADAVSQRAVDSNAAACNPADPAADKKQMLVMQQQLLGRDQQQDQRARQQQQQQQQHAGGGANASCGLRIVLPQDAAGPQPPDTGGGAGRTHTPQSAPLPGVGAAGWGTGWPATAPGGATATHDGSVTGGSPVTWHGPSGGAWLGLGLGIGPSTDTPHSATALGGGGGGGGGGAATAAAAQAVPAPLSGLKRDALFGADLALWTGQGEGPLITTEVVPDRLPTPTGASIAAAAAKPATGPSPPGAAARAAATAAPRTPPLPPGPPRPAAEAAAAASALHASLLGGTSSIGDAEVAQRGQGGTAAAAAAAAAAGTAISTAFDMPSFFFTSSPSLARCSGATAAAADDAAAAAGPDPRAA